MSSYGKLAEIYDDLVVIEGSHARWAAYLDELWAGEVLTVLDVCCGTGLLAAELTARGYEVVGIDGSEEMLARARERVRMPLHRTTLPALPDLGVFDAAVSTFDSFNYLSPDDLRAALAALAPHVRANGWLVFDLHTDLQLRFIAQHPDIAGEGYRLTNVVEGRTCATTLELGSLRETHVQYFHADDDVRSALADAGFDLVGVRDDYSDRPADAETQAATWVARRTSRRRRS
jgi:SAM-dependent methyltransferase